MVSIFTPHDKYYEFQTGYTQLTVHETVHFMKEGWKYETQGTEFVYFFAFKILHFN